MNASSRVLVVAGSDSSGGAGIARDIETIAAFGLKASLALTAVTVQTHDSVRAVETMRPSLVEEQMRAALAANPVAAIKIGMLASTETIEAVAGVLRDHPHISTVLDPVLASSSGRALLASEAATHLKRDLMPLCALVTPNLPELALLADREKALEEAQPVQQGTQLLKEYCRAVLVKGGHASGKNAVDILLRPNAPPKRFSLPRLSAGMRGTGCILSSAVACQLAQGKQLEDSIRIAKRYLHEHLVEQGKDTAANQ